MTKVCVEVGGVSQMNLSSKREAIDNSSSGNPSSIEVLPENPNRVYLAITSIPSVGGYVTFGAPYDPSSNTPIPISISTYDKVVPIDAVYFYMEAGRSGSMTVFEGTTPQEN